MDAKDELDRETEFDDLVREAMYGAISNAEGAYSSKYLRYELRKRGLCIASDVPILYKVKSPYPPNEYIIFGNKIKAANFANSRGWIMEPLYAAII